MEHNILARLVIPRLTLEPGLRRRESLVNDVLPLGSSWAELGTSYIGPLSCKQWRHHPELLHCALSNSKTEALAIHFMNSGTAIVS